MGNHILAVGIREGILRSANTAGPGEGPNPSIQAFHLRTSDPAHPLWMQTLMMLFSRKRKILFTSVTPNHLLFALNDYRLVVGLTHGPVTVLKLLGSVHHGIIKSVHYIVRSFQLPLTFLYVVSGLPKVPHIWSLADPDSVMSLTHSDGAINPWW